MIDIPSPNWLRAAYAANILILLPVCGAMMSASGTAAVFDARVAESQGLRLMVVSLWIAILLASVIGLFTPSFAVPVLAIQVIYKSLWLALFIMPLLLRGNAHLVPWGITLTFIAIVLTYPLLMVRAFAQAGFG